MRTLWLPSLQAHILKWQRKLISRLKFRTLGTCITWVRSWLMTASGVVLRETENENCSHQLDQHFDDTMIDLSNISNIYIIPKRDRQKLMKNLLQTVCKQNRFLRASLSQAKPLYTQNANVIFSWKLIWWKLGGNFIKYSCANCGRCAFSVMFCVTNMKFWGRECSCYDCCLLARNANAKY